MSTALEFITRYWGKALEVILLWFIIYNCYRYFRATRGARIFTGLVSVWIALTLLSEMLNFEVIGSLLRASSVFLAISLVVIFQPELRRALAELGSHRWFSPLGSEGQHEFAKLITEIVSLLSRKRVGCLIAIQRGIDLKHCIETGVAMDCITSREVVHTVFHTGTVLHDGGMIVRLSDERIVAAGCVFPVTQRELSDRSIGLRHRAAIGITEESDALAIAVSEETGHISLAFEGVLERNLSVDEFGKRLKRLLLEEENPDEEETPDENDSDA